MMLYKFVLDGFLTSGAWCMWMIMVLLWIGLGFVAERVWFLFINCGSGGGTLMSGVSKYVKAGEFDKAIKYAASQKTPLAKGVVAILQNRGRGAKAVQKAVDEVFLTESPKITRNIAFIPTIANVTTLVGLMGTIYGLMLAFDAIANVPAAQRAQALAAGISMSMSSTLWALLVAVPLLVAHGALAQKSDGVLQQLDEKATKLINMVEA
ncbi:MAG: MotA/TolQ/ExbB proton channel family protein [Chitinispirillia bacterium]|nr:MotA/TolQ/ExbB proton channel family protein [Chitinispirillia bacterium]MCL2267962.1 MotA/TolQ/ExbB proton channel family protein [Chitinispirillia bacterium]